MKEKDEIRKKIRDLIHEVDPQAEVILFGSRARKEARKESDWDLLILVPRPVNLKEEQKFRHKLFEIEMEYEQSISVFLHSKAEWESKFKITPLYRNIQREGVRI